MARPSHQLFDRGRLLVRVVPWSGAANQLGALRVLEDTWTMFPATRCS